MHRCCVISGSGIRYSVICIRSSRNSLISAHSFFIHGVLFWSSVFSFRSLPAPQRISAALRIQRAASRSLIACFRILCKLVNKFVTFSRSASGRASIPRDGNWETIVSISRIEAILTRISPSKLDISMLSSKTGTSRGCAQYAWQVSNIVLKSSTCSPSWTSLISPIKAFVNLELTL